MHLVGLASLSFVGSSVPNAYVHGLKSRHRKRELRSLVQQSRSPVTWCNEVHGPEKPHVRQHEEQVISFPEYVTVST